jgi:signal transduction histidine kinase/ActR/RegA family two-component response regulator
MIEDAAIARRWIVAGLAAALAFILSGLAHPDAGPASQLPYLLALTLVAVVCGRGPAVMVLALAMGVALWRIFEGSSRLPEPAITRTAILLGYLALGTLIILIADATRRQSHASATARAEFDLAMAAANVGSWHYDYRARKLTYSSNIGPMIARPPGFVHGNLAEWMEEVHPDDREALKRALQDASRGNSYEVSYRLRTEGSEWRWLMVRGRITRDVDGQQLLRADGVVMDITGTRNAELDLRRSTEELRTILDLIPAGVAIAHDAGGNQITVSPRFARILRIDESVRNASYTGDERERLPYVCMRDGVEIPGDQLPMQVAARSGREVHDFEIDLVFDDQSVVNLLASAAPLFDATGKVRGAIGVHTDITALKTAQRELQRMDEQKDVFLATLAHELRNPLAPIGYAAARLRRHAEPAAVAEAGRIIERQTAQMRQLLDELLDMSRITRNVIELRREPVDVTAILRHEVEAVKAQYADQSRHIALHCDSTAWVTGDETRLHQIVGNLLNNACKYSRADGHIEVNLRTQGDELRISVRDDGIGIAREDLPRVFELFAQIRKPGMAPVGGLGIGLAVVRRLVELHGGRVTVTSPGLGAGTEFVVVLPALHHASTSAQTADSVGHAAPREAHVLVCDDNVDAADTLAHLLQLHGFAVHVAYDGASAQRLAAEVHPDAAVLDLGLADRPGEDVASWIRAQPWSAGLLLVAVTGWGQEHDRQRTADAGFAHHLVKPVDPDELVALLVAHVGGNRSTQQA